MSSTRALGGAEAGAPSGSGRRKCGRPFGSRNRAKDPAATPPVPRRRGRPPGSRNKRTLEALAATAVVESAGAAPATAVTAAPAGVVALATTNAVAPTGATSIAGLSATTLEAAAAIVGAAIAIRAAPPGLAGAGIGGSSSASAAKVRKPRRLPPRQRLSYISEHGFTTFVVHLRGRVRGVPAAPRQFCRHYGEEPPDEHHGGGGQWRPAPVPR
jgi:hypothetical protein